MIQATCPICRKAIRVDRPDDLPTFPFCSERCRLIDLGRWADGSYTIPGPSNAPAEGPESGPADEPTDE